VTERPTHGPLPQGSPELQPAADAVLDPAEPRETLAAHAERLVVAGTSTGGRAVVVKVDRSLERHQREASVLRTLRSSGVPVPEVVDARQREDEVAACVLLLERVEGRPLSDSHGPATWSSVGEGLARLHSAVPSPDGPPFAGQRDGTFAAHLRAWLAIERRLGVDGGWLTQAQADRLGAMVGAAVARTDDVAPVLLHGDCSPQHWLVDEHRGAVRPIDLGDAGVGDPVYDLMVLTLTAPERLAIVLDGYRADPALQAHVTDVLAGYRSLRLAGDVSWLLDHGYDPTPSRMRLEAALR
jgi:aminoglycoside phosphotransferase (APT) family kinase protein